MKKILLINGHPNPDSFCYSLAKAYSKGVGEQATLRQIDVARLNFDVGALKHFDSFEIPVDLQKAQADIRWANHIVIVHPIWWATMPALLKSFIEQTFLMGFAAKYEKSGKITKLLTDKSMRVISTLDTPVFLYKSFLGNPSFKVHKANFSFCGIKPIRQTYLGPVVKSDEVKRKKWIKKVEQLGKRLV